MAKGEQVWAKIPFMYDGENLDRGQVFKLAGARNDEKLLKFNYVGQVKKGDEVYECAKCGAKFIGYSEREHHGKTRHIDRALTPYEEDALADRIDKQIAETAQIGPGAA